MSRAVLPEDQIHPAIRARVSAHHADLLDEVRNAIAKHAVVVVGMAGNPFPKKARRMLDAMSIAHHDLDYGSYFSQWRRRTALKMWSGWPTFPMIFLCGQLIGGADDLERLISSGELQRLLTRPLRSE